MPPSEAKQLTIAEAYFYLASEERVKSACRKMNLRVHFGRDVTPREVRDAHQRRMTSLRKQYTGSEDILHDI